MTIPTSVTTALTSLQNQVVAAAPLDTASHATIEALQLNAATLVVNLDSALAAAADQLPSEAVGPIEIGLDTWIAQPDPLEMIYGIGIVYGQAVDQWTLAVMRGIVGRASTNLDLL